MAQYVSWATGDTIPDPDASGDWGGFMRFSARFYSIPRAVALYRQYVGALVLRTNTFTKKRYADDPAVMAWELSNEPRPGTDGLNGRSNVEDFVRWNRETAAFIHSLDPNHLVTTGSERKVGCIQDTSLFIRTHAESRHRLRQLPPVAEELGMVPRETDGRDSRAKRGKIHGVPPPAHENGAPARHPARGGTPVGAAGIEFDLRLRLFDAWDPYPPRGPAQENRFTESRTLKPFTFTFVHSQRNASLTQYGNKQCLEREIFSAKIIEKGTDDINIGYNIRLYSLPELQSILSRNGFEIINTWGDFDKTEYSVRSRRLITLSKKIKNLQKTNT
jgi:hypothetical protein